MNAQQNNGGPAFPRAASEFTAGGTLPDGNDAIQAQDGMSLRDWFAGQVISGLVLRALENEEGLSPVNIHNLWARAAYATAEAMLKAREQ